MGQTNFVETSMSLKQLEIHKILDVVTREYTINLMTNQTWTVVIGELMEYFQNGKGEIKNYITRLSQELPLVLKVKQITIWIRDLQNNYLWTYTHEIQY
jgi:hypothetical protein